ncbi:SAM-dependent methyltransferase [bacterium]|nr:SAM-dependent methyltransferase [bacterium]
MTPRDGVHEASFRDPCGFVYRRGGVLYRQVNAAGLADYEALMSSGLYEELTAAGVLIPHEEVGKELAQNDLAARVLRPELVPFVSHPYEWCCGALRDAALLTLAAERAALRRGLTLKDASAYNVQFRHGRPVLIDTLSFARLREGEPWLAYRQFCQHFLAPLALMALRDVRLGSLLRVHLDGVPLDLAGRLLPWRSRLRPGLLMHLHLHARSQARWADKPGKARDVSRKGMSPRAREGLVDSLEGAVRGLKSKPVRSAWRDYYDESSYSEEAMRHKEDLVGAYLANCTPGMVWDLGANTGRFARLAAAAGRPTVAWDLDPHAVEAAYATAPADGVLPLVLDLSNPSPSLGWAHRERASLAARGPAQTTLALALLHHLAVAGNVPLPRIADFLAEITRELIVEFVPKSDPQVRRLLASREDVFPDYHREGFEAAFAARFETARSDVVRGTDRTLYLMRRREG